MVTRGGGGGQPSAPARAVANIPCYFGLPTDGVAGPDTYFLFGQGVGPQTTYGGPVYGSRQLGPGTSGKEGIILQNRLNCFQAFSTGRPAPGTFDSASAEAVLAFKRQTESNGAPSLPAHPIAGFGFYDASWLITCAGGRAIFPGRNGFDVVFLQVVLLELTLFAAASPATTTSPPAWRWRPSNASPASPWTGWRGRSPFITWGWPITTRPPAPWGYRGRRPRCLR